MMKLTVNSKSSTINNSSIFNSNFIEFYFLTATIGSKTSTISSETSTIISNPFTIDENYYSPFIDQKSSTNKNDSYFGYAMKRVCIFRFFSFLALFPPINEVVIEPKK